MDIQDNQIVIICNNVRAWLHCDHQYIIVGIIRFGEGSVSSSLWENQEVRSLGLDKGRTYENFFTTERDSLLWAKENEKEEHPNGEA